jgi:uncharacterized protein YhfF
MESVQEMWAAFLSATPEVAASAPPYSAWCFGDDKAAADELVELVRGGRKRATASSLWVYQVEDEAIPQAGEFSVITDWDGRARCIIRTTSVEIVPFESVTPEFAAAEGEGDLSLDYWRQVHWAFFTRELRGTGRQPESDMPVVCERFEVVFGAGPERASATRISRAER